MSQSLSLFHVSDVHFGYEDRGALDWFAGEVAREKPDWVICTGDLTMRGNAREYAAAARWFSALEAPVSLELGNHDVPYYWYPLARIFKPYQLFNALDAEVGALPNLPDLSLTRLRTAHAFQWRINLSKGRVAPADLAAAVSEVQTSSKPLRLVACHHPLIEADTEATASTSGGAEALAALAAAGADAVLSGHVHDAFDQTVTTLGGPIRMIGAGTLSQRLRGSPPSYNRLEWSAESGLQVEARRFD